jgi:hydrogenase maturation protease
MATLTILGIGNILMRDEGVGVRLMEAVRDARAWPDEIEFIDGGVGGLNLLNIIEEAERLIVFDAADMGLPAGQARVIAPEQVMDEDAAGRLSMHEVPFIETLRLCERFSRRPPTTILAIQPVTVERGRELSEEILAAFDGLKRQAIELVAAALDEGRST